MESIRIAIEPAGAADYLETAENAIRTVPGVLSVRSQPGDRELHVTAADTIEPEMLVTALRKAGLIGIVLG